MTFWYRSRFVIFSDPGRCCPCEPWSRYCILWNKYQFRVFLTFQFCRLVYTGSASWKISWRMAWILRVFAFWKKNCCRARGLNKLGRLAPTVTQGVAFCQLTSTSGSDSVPIVHRRVLIADSNSQCVQVFSATSGECLLKFGVRGRQASQLQRPTGIAVTANGNYLVSDYDNKWVGVFSPEGKYINRSAASLLWFQ